MKTPANPQWWCYRLDFSVAAGVSTLDLTRLKLPTACDSRIAHRTFHATFSQSVKLLGLVLAVKFSCFPPSTDYRCNGLPRRQSECTIFYLQYNMSTAARRLACIQRKFTLITHSLTHSMEQRPSWSANRFSAVQKFSTLYGNPESSLSRLQEPVTCPYPEPDQSSSYAVHRTSWRSVLILSSHLCLPIPSGLFPSGFHTKTPYETLLSKNVLNTPLI